MEKQEEEKIVKFYKGFRKTTMITSIIMALGMLVMLVVITIPFNQIIYKNRYEELYEHQAEYLMNDEMPDFDDVFEREEFCNFVDIDFEQGGQWLELNGELYFQDVKMEFTNLSSKNFTDLGIEVYAIDYEGKRWTSFINIGEVAAGQSVTKEMSMPRLCIVKNVCRVSESRVKNAVCYAIDRGDQWLSPYEVAKKIDESLIVALIGEMPEPAMSGVTKFITIGILVAFLPGVILKVVNEIRDYRLIENGEYTVEDGEVILNKDKKRRDKGGSRGKWLANLKQEVEEIEVEEEIEDDDMQEEKPLEKIGETLPSDFDDGHKTTHDCGGFDIDQKDYSIDPKDY